jgi:hypothetical protein
MANLTLAMDINYHHKVCSNCGVTYDCHLQFMVQATGRESLGNYNHIFPKWVP